MKRYQTSILNLKDQSISQIDKKIKFFKNKYQDSVKEDGIIWILSNSVTEKGKFYHTPFYIAEQFNELFLKNIIIAPSFLKNNGEAIFKNYVTNILFLSKNEKYYFNKDPIREKHIWKNVEWGKRKKNYNPKGKDPGNVWLKTKDDGKANITEHCPLSFEEIIERCYLTSSKPKDDVLLINLNKQKSNNKFTYVTI